MRGFDLRYTIPIFTNWFKSQSGALPWGWDAFSLLKDPNQTTWTQKCVHVFLFLLPSFTSITLSLARPAAAIRFQFPNFSRHIALSLVCSLLFPQALFWFLYPAILMFSRFLGCVNIIRLFGDALPVWNVNLHISSNLTHDQEETNIHTIESEVPVAQVSSAISPEDGYWAEA
ncbi:hypothetical protein L484_023380 [Morus notabilis]|uniref:Uncharacterized protein n=1 Tax=Morus notabilis TaxID=981085 RepID=W9SU77_9ROSA|nr:hypothetical protein L484_023380 [Morus notabilis]